VNAADAVGRVCAEQITPYPPGIPAIVKGVSQTVSRLAAELEAGLAQQMKELDAVGASVQGQPARRPCPQHDRHHRPQSVPRRGCS
jgi:arginine decarboxylase